MISFIIPSRNNFDYLRLAYHSIRKYYPSDEIVLLDDDSSDQTKSLLTSILAADDNVQVYFNRDRQVGHTVLYDKGVELCKNEIFTIFHADMVIGPNYLENLIKHLRRGTVVSATRIEPPLHPPGKEKIVKDFGTYHDDFKMEEFTKFCEEKQTEFDSQTTKGIFAPWIMYKEDFLAIGGHDKFFAPFPFEDSDIFQRFILNGYNIVQSRDAFVYHFTCRGHRWSKEVGKDDHFYKLCVAKNQAHYIRKWGSWITNDELSCPIIRPKYDIGFSIENCNQEILGLLEPWCSTIYTDFKDSRKFIDMVQPGTPFDMNHRVKTLSQDDLKNDIIVRFDAKLLNHERFQFLTKLSQVLNESGEIGNMEYDIFSITIKSLNRRESDLINNDSFYSTLRADIDSKDPYFLDELFRVVANTNQL